MYYVLECDGPYPTLPIAETGRLPGGPWYKGQMLTDFVKSKITAPLEYQVVRSRQHGNLKAMYSGEARPLMRDDLVHALQTSGIDNLELFPATIKDPKTGITTYNFKAFNIIGLVACADMDASEVMGTSDSEILDVDFSSLVIDESKTHNLPLFRLAEACSAIIVHERVKEAIEAHKIPGMVFYGPGEWSG